MGKAWYPQDHICFEQKLTRGPRVHASLYIRLLSTRKQGPLGDCPMQHPTLRAGALFSTMGRRPLWGSQFRHIYYDKSVILGTLSRRIFAGFIRKTPSCDHFASHRDICAVQRSLTSTATSLGEQAGMLIVIAM